MDKIVIGNNGGTMSPKKWNELMLHLEEKGFSWRNKMKPTSQKCPSEFYRQVFLYNKEKEITFGEIGIHPSNVFISVNDFIKK